MTELLKSKKNFVWMDLEMTGLDPEKEKIIEMATLITDQNLNILAQGPRFVIHQNEKILAAMDEWNQRHHQKSGLLEEVKRSDITSKKAERLTLAFIKKYCHPKKSPLCGNAIHHDRRFLIKYMPSINDYLHYRHVDVSTVKILIHQWYPQDKKQHPKKSDKHRALDDIRQSIEELRYYRDTYFKK